MNKKILFSIAIISTVTLSSAVFVASLNESKSFAPVASKCSDNNHSGFHYSEVDSTEEKSGHKEFWTCCVCHQSWLSNPGGTFTEGTDFDMTGGISTEHVAYIPKKDHVHTPGLFTSNNDATCQNNGTKSAICTGCGETIIITNEGTKKDHIFNIKNTNSAYLKIKGDCEHESQYYYSCACGEHSLNTFTTGEIGDHVYGKPTLYGLDKIKKVCIVCGKSIIEDRYKTLSIDATNDYHGAVNGSFPLLAFGSYFKEESLKPNTLLIDSGDTWKGPIESNYNYGQLVNEVMNYCHFDARTVGNHDFDYGLDKLLANTAASYEGYSTPVLASNVYDYNWSTKQLGNVQQSDIGREYVTYTLENGLKVGIVGVLTENEIQTICQNLVPNVGFKNSIDTAKTLSDYLRTKEKCDIVVVSAHDGVQEMKRIGTSLVDVSEVTGKKYADIVLCSHTHNFETEEINGVLFAQCDASGTSFRKINLEYDAYLDEIYDYDQITVFGSGIAKSYVADPNVQAIINKYIPEVNAKKSEVVHTNISNKFNKTQATNLLAKAIFDEAQNQGYDVSYSFVYQASGEINAGSLNYGQLYDAYKFNNIAYILDVKGSEIISLFTKQPETDMVALGLYRGTNANAISAIDPSKTYRIVSLDKVAFHVAYTNGGARTYDYFPTGNAITYLTKNSETYYYREIICDYLKAHTEAIKTSDYSGNHYDQSLLNVGI